MSTKVTMPQLGESVVEGTVGRWLVEEGQAVEKDTPLVEILTDKADSEVPSPASGVITKIHAPVDAVVAVGQALCELDESASASASKSGTKSKPKAQRNATSAESSKASSESSDSTSAPMASPAVRRLARDKNVDIETLKGTGLGGRITEADVLRSGDAVDSRVTVIPQSSPASNAPAPSSVTTSASNSGAFRPPPYQPSPGDEVVPFSRRRRIIADHMVYSKATSPEVVTFSECDLHRASTLRDAHKAQFKKEGLGLNFLSFVCVAVCRSLREHPEVNARVLDNAYVKLKNINLGIAVDTPQGLVVPVIRNADELTIRGIAKSIGDIAKRARDGKLTPDDLAGKTFTVSNPGRRGNLVGGAIISQPNVAILRMGTIKKRVVVVERDGEDLMAIHPMMQMALTYDHRIIDGVHANSFLYRITEMLEQGDFNID